MADVEQTKYAQDIQRIQDIVLALSGRDCDIDNMLELVKEATDLIAKCQDKLAKTGIEIDEALKKLEATSRVEHPTSH